MNCLFDEIMSDNYETIDRRSASDDVLSVNFDKIAKRVTKIISLSNATRYANLDEEGINNYIRLIPSETPVDIDLLLPSIIAYGRIVLGIKDFENKDRLTRYYLFESIYKRSLKRGLSRLSKNGNSAFLKDKPFSDRLKGIFSAAQLSTVNDLSKQSVNSLLCLAFYDIDNFISIIDTPSFFPFTAEELFDVVLRASKYLGNNSKSYICLRCDTNGDRLYNDDDICAKLDVPISYVKKLEQSELHYISKDDFWWFFRFGIYAYYLIKGEKQFLTFSETQDLTGGDYLLFLSFMLIWNKISGWSPLIVNIDLLIVYDSNALSLDDILEGYYSYLPTNYLQCDVPFNDTEMAIIRWKNNRQGDNEKNDDITPHMSRIVRDVLERDFGDGYRISNDDDFETLKRFIKIEYNVSTDQLTQHAVAALISNDNNFILCDRGTYMLRSFCPSFPRYLPSVIINYIENECGKTVYYDTLYSRFESSLKSSGIDNVFLFKGLLDPLLPSSMQTKRNYIIQNGSNHKGSTNAVQNNIDKIRKYEGVFSFDDLHKIFPGIKDYVIYNYLYSEEQNGLLFLANKHFVYFNNLLFDDSDIEDLGEFIEDTFRTSKKDIISVKFLYSRLSLLDKNLLRRINDDALDLFYDEFSMFSLIRKLYPEKYYYDRPYISKIFDIKLTAPSIIAYFLKDEEYVSWDVIRRTAQGLGCSLSTIKFDEVCEYLASTHVLIDSSNLVRKDLVNFSNDAKDDVDEILNHYLSIGSGEKANTKDMNYNLFPQCGYKWNGYLITGVIRSYLNDKYIVIKEDAAMKHDYFVIRRISNE